MNVNNYYSISFRNDQLVITRELSKIQKSSLPDILSTLIQLNPAQYTDSDFGEIWNDIKARIEHKKSGCTGWIVNIFYFLSGRNSLINQIDLKVKTLTQHVEPPKVNMVNEFKKKSELDLSPQNNLASSDNIIINESNPKNENETNELENVDKMDLKLVKLEQKRKEIESKRNQEYQYILEKKNSLFLHYIDQVQKNFKKKASDHFANVDQDLCQKTWKAQKDFVFWALKSTNNPYSSCFTKNNNSKLLNHEINAFEASNYYPLKLNYSGRQLFFIVYDEMSCSEFRMILKMFHPELRSILDSKVSVDFCGNYWKEDKPLNSYINLNKAATARLVFD